MRDLLDKKQLAILEHKERTTRGMRAAKSRGVFAGQPMKFNQEQAIEFPRYVLAESKLDLGIQKAGRSADEVSK